jgi:hypothetical protein
MTEAAILLDERGAPDLQLLVPELAGYANIAAAEWRAFDQAMRAYHAGRNAILAPAPPPQATKQRRTAR